jgi:site-specific recombinase
VGGARRRRDRPDHLAVSFVLALRTALGARQIRFMHWGPVLGAVWRRLRTQPRSFALPPRPAPPADAGS